MHVSDVKGMMPWVDRRGRLSFLRLAVFVLAGLPACWMAYQWFGGLLSPKPITDMLRQAGDWTIRFLVITLAVSPVRALTKWNAIIGVRRMLGLFTLFYALVHLTFYFIDQNFIVWRIALEIVLRTYLTIGFAVLVIMLVMGATSNDTMARRLGAQRWQRIHRWVYVAAFGGLLHFFLQVRIKAYEPSMLSGFCFLLGGYRLLARRRKLVPLWQLGGLAVLSALATALIEAGYYRISMNAPILVVLQANTDFSFEIRPMWWVLAAGAAMLVAACIGRLRDSASKPRARTGKQSLAVDAAVAE